MRKCHHEMWYTHCYSLRHLLDGMHRWVRLACWEEARNMNTNQDCFFLFLSTLRPMSKKKKNRWSLTQLPLSESISEIIMSISQIIFNLQYIHHAMQLWQSVFLLLLFWSTPLSKKKTNKTWPPLSEPISEISKFEVHIQTIHTRNSSVLVASMFMFCVLQLVKANSWPCPNTYTKTL